MPKDGQREQVDTIIFSDLHISGALCHAKAFRTALGHFVMRRIIANGDIFENSNFKSGILAPFPSRKLNEENRPHRLRRSHQDVLRDINDRVKHGCQVWWGTGNHDDDLWKVIAIFLGASVCEEYEWMYQGKKFLAIHGDQFDSFYHRYRWTSEIATWIYGWIQNLGQRGRWLCAILKNRSKHYSRAIDHVAQGATLHALHREAQHVFCGHTHQAEYRFLNGVHYYNSGCWTQDPCSFITIGEKGIRIHYFDADGNETGLDGPYPI